MVLVAIILLTLVFAVIVCKAVIPDKNQDHEEAVIVESTTKKYRCADCANKRSPLCKLCKIVDHPGGFREKPSQYIKMADVKLQDIISAKDKTREEAVEIVIQRYLDEGAPIPTSLVLEYNKHHEEET